tara:strand:- start:3166 stop:3843 length:678 start_codon:yes stop_codon:yes gene_type:complete
MTTIGDVVSRIRQITKAEVQDAFVTDRMIYSLVLKFAQTFMRRQDNANKLMKFNSVWQSLPFVELIEVDKVEAECSGIQSGCTIMRTKEKLPLFMEGYWGPLIRTVSSIDGSVEMQATMPGTYTSMTKTTSFKYNKTKYFWWLNNYIYVPNATWKAIKIEGIFEGDISKWNCDLEDDCVPRYLQQMFIPEFLFAEIEQQVVMQLANTMKIPGDQGDNKKHILREE